MIYNYHTHTHMCGHASGTMEEYVLRAIEGGIRFMGFSEHAPFVRADGCQSRYRLQISDIDAYVSEVQRLKEKYKHRIDIKMGLEMEYYPDDFDTMVKTARNMGVQYLILGEHFEKDESQNAHYANTGTDSEEKLKKYVSAVTEAMRTGFFTYVAHPDIFKFEGDDDIYSDNMRILCRCSAQCGVALEINFLGFRQGRNYPFDAFWRIAGEEGSPVTMGCDAHSAVDACDSASVEKANQLIKKYSLNYIGMPKLVPISDK